MRTTIELRDDQRDALADLARERGERGYSALIQEAVDRFLRERDEEVRKRRLAALDEAIASFTPEYADHLDEVVSDLRSRWQTR